MILCLWPSSFLHSIPPRNQKKQITFKENLQPFLNWRGRKRKIAESGRFYKEFKSAVFETNIKEVCRLLRPSQRADIKRDVNLVAYCPKRSTLLTMLNYGIHEQSSSKALDLIRILIAAGADVNIGTPGHTPLSAAVRANRVEIFEVLLLHGADANKRTYGLPTAWEEAEALQRDKILALKERYQPTHNVSLQTSEVLVTQEKIQADNDWVDSLFVPEKQ